MQDTFSAQLTASNFFISSLCKKLLTTLISMAAVSDFSSSKPAQLISGDGNFHENVDGDLKLSSDNGLVGVVSIMGVQSSGKSTLMNKCFNTDFREMNQETGMSQTTRGIWMSKLVGGSGPQVLLLDCEGSDGAERGLQGNETFERKVTFFALASSDVVMINMKCDNVNLYNGASMPLIRNVFQVMVRKFSIPRRITLLFVLRDKNKAPLEKLRSQLTRQLNETWENMCNDLAPPYPSLDDYFKVEVKALSHYRYEREAFNAEVVELREWVFELVKNGRLSPSANFINLTQKNWSDIQADKILNLVLNKNAVDEVFFNTIKDDIIQKFSHDKIWTDLKRDVRIDLAEHFGHKVSALIDTYLSEFDEETKSFSENSRKDSRAQITERLLEMIEDTYLSFLGNKKASALKRFEQDVKQKIEALDSNFDTEAYTKAFFESLIEAKVEQAEDWNQPYDNYQEAKSHIDRYVERATEIIQQRKEWEANKAAQASQSRGDSDLVALGNLFGNLALVAAKIFIPSAGLVLDAARNLNAQQDGYPNGRLPPPLRNDAYYENNHSDLPKMHAKISSDGKF